MDLLTWEQYSSLHHDTVKSETEFKKYEARAEKQLSSVVGPIRYYELICRDISEEFYAGQLRECIANIIDYDVQTQETIGKGLASVSNDGYSESYVVQKRSDAEKELALNIRLWLSGTGLVRAY